MPDNANPAMAQAGILDFTQADAAIEQNTSNLIIGITNVFNSGMSYHDIIMGVLGMISDILHPDRLLIFERGSETTGCTFEWHAEGCPPRIQHMQNMPNEQFDAISKLASGESPVLTSSVDEMGERDEKLAQRFNRRGVERMMAIPLTNDGKVIGYLSANNYRLEKSVDAKRVLDTVAPFISTRMANQRLVEQLERAGSHDSLTGVLNRRGIDDAIERRLAEKPGEPYALALMDIDDFKVVNDLHGHDVGDAALRTLADVITGAFPPSAIIGRNGGDEFLAMLFGDDLARTDELLEAFSNASFACEHDGKTYPLSMSVGYAEYPNQADDLQDAYTKADAALYTVKLSGKAGFKKYSPEDDMQQRLQFGFSPRDLADKVPCGIVVCKRTEHGEILYCNDELIKMFDCESFVDFIDFTGGTFEGMIHPDDRAETFEDLMRQLQNGASDEKSYLDYRIITKKGIVKRVADSSRLSHGETVGDVSYVLLVDLGEREMFKKGR